MEWNTTSFLLLVSGCAGAVLTLTKAFNEATRRLDARKQRIKAQRIKDITDAVEVKRIQANSDEQSHKDLVEYLWQIIESQKVEIAQLETDGKLTRPVVKQIYFKLRELRHKIEALKLTQEEEKSLKDLLDATEEMLP